MTDCQFAIDGNNNGDFICGVVEGFYGRPWTFEQRYDLFKRLKSFNLNTFMYAPKDDCKHRANWRQLYSETETRELKSLIDSAKSHGIDFYYSLAPGLDMVYSDQADLDCLIRKYDQLVDLGCECFAILFDDIKPEISGKDSQVFKDYASAQVSVTNMIFEHLNKPKFIFCPTEYCESRAVPNLSDSHYLKILGSGLDENIDIMWTGSRVISRLITEESIEDLTKLIRRSPLIWENLHANDYDRRRVFLGPYSGRSTRLISKLKGILTNPNCEYEANHIAIHTLAQWSRCTQDINMHNRCVSNLLVDERLAIDSSVDPSVYDPNRALVLAIKNWLPKVLKSQPYPSGITAFGLDDLKQNRKDDTALQQLTSESDDQNVVDMIADESQSSGASTNTNKSDMDTSGSSALATNLNETNSCDSCEMQEANQNSQENITQKSTTNTTSQSTDYFTGSLNKSSAINDESNSVITFNDLSLLVELFFLPFEHGSSGANILKEIKWLRDNSNILLPEGSEKSQNATNVSTENDDSGSDSQDTIECKSLECWRSRADKLSLKCSTIARLTNTMIYDCPNKPLVVDLYPYLVDLRESITSVIEYIRFLRCRSSMSETFDGSNGNRGNKKQYKPEISSDEQEPWVHRGGLMGDIYRLIY